MGLLDFLDKIENLTQDLVEGRDGIVAWRRRAQPTNLPTGRTPGTPNASHRSMRSTSAKGTPVWPQVTQCRRPGTAARGRTLVKEAGA